MPELTLGGQLCTPARRLDMADISRGGPIAIAGRAGPRRVFIARRIDDAVSQPLEGAVAHHIFSDLAGRLHIARGDGAALDVEDDRRLPVRPTGLGAQRDQLPVSASRPIRRDGYSSL